jgi:predicted secreted protein
MTWVSAIVVFLITWWTVLFAVLPWGNRPAENPEPGHEPAAPAQPRLLRKFAVTTLISAVIFVGIYLFIEFDVFSFRTWVAND